MEFKELADKLAEKGLDLRNATRIESLSGEHLTGYNMSSDIVNLFPTLLAASINDLNSIENSDKLVDAMSIAIIDQLCDDAFTEVDGIEFEALLLKKLKTLRNAYPKCFAKMVNKFFVNALLSYFVANKFGMRSCTEKVGGKGYFHYFALLDFLDDLEPETQDMIVKDLAKKHLWDVTEEDIEEEF